MKRPRLACCNFIADVNSLKEFALDNHFDGIDWSFTQDNLPSNPAEESKLVKMISGLQPLEVRYHCAFKRMDLGDLEAHRAEQAMTVFRRICRLVSKVGGRFLTIHVGLGRNSTNNISWNRTIDGLSELTRFANGMGVRLCLENLAWGWTSRPELFEKLIRKSGVWATLDIGHARVSPYVKTQHYDVQDFVNPHPDRFLNAHIYHEEDENQHLPPRNLAQIEDRLAILTELNACDWWVLELREEQALLETLDVVRTFIDETNLTPRVSAGPSGPGNSRAATQVHATLSNNHSTSLPNLSR